MSEKDRIDELEDVLRDILDLSVGFTRKMPEGERLELIRSLAGSALTETAA